jgi:hypothetical protein
VDDEWRRVAAIGTSEVREGKTMIRTILTLAIVAAAGMLVGVGRAEEPAKEVKLTGTMMCGKCSLKMTTKCSNALQVKEGDKLVNYFIDDKGNGETYHEAVCGDGKVEGVTVTGTVTEKDGKKWIKATKVDVPKKD